MRKVSEGKLVGKEGKKGKGGKGKRGKGKGGKGKGRRRQGMGNGIIHACG